MTQDSEFGAFSGLPDDTIVKLENLFASYKADRLRIYRRASHYVEDYLKTIDPRRSRKNLASLDELLEKYAGEEMDPPVLLRLSSMPGERFRWEQKDISIILNRNVSSVSRNLTAMENDPQWKACLDSIRQTVDRGPTMKIYLYADEIFDVFLDFYASEYIQRRIIVPRHGTPLSSRETALVWKYWEKLKNGDVSAGSSDLSQLSLLSFGASLDAEIETTLPQEQECGHSLRDLCKTAKRELCHNKSVTAAIAVFSQFTDLSRKMRMIFYAVPVVLLPAIAYCAIKRRGKNIAPEHLDGLNKVMVFSSFFLLLWGLSFAGRVFSGDMSKSALSELPAVQAVYAKLDSINKKQDEVLDRVKTTQTDVQSVKRDTAEISKKQTEAADKAAKLQSTAEGTKKTTEKTQADIQSIKRDTSEINKELKKKNDEVKKKNAAVKKHASEVADNTDRFATEAVEDSKKISNSDFERNVGICDDALAELGNSDLYVKAKLLSARGDMFLVWSMRVQDTALTKISEARGSYSDALKCKNALKDEMVGVLYMDIATTYQQEADIREKTKMLGLAEEYFKKAEPYMEKAGDGTGKFNFYNNFAQFYVAMSELISNDSDKTRKLILQSEAPFNKAIKIADKLGDRQKVGFASAGLAMAYSRLALEYTYSQNIGKAELYNNKSIALYDKAIATVNLERQQREYAIYNINLSQNYRRRYDIFVFKKDLKQSAEALKNALAALKKAIAFNGNSQYFDAAETRLTSARIMTKLALIKRDRKHFDDAIAEYDKVLALYPVSTMLQRNILAMGEKLQLQYAAAIVEKSPDILKAAIASGSEYLGNYEQATKSYGAYSTFNETISSCYKELAKYENHDENMEQAKKYGSR